MERDEMQRLMYSAGAITDAAAARLLMAMFWSRSQIRIISAAFDTFLVVSVAFGYDDISN